MNWNPLKWLAKASPMPGVSDGGVGFSMLPATDLVDGLKPPTEQRLVALYRDTAYYCANLNARGVAKTPLYVYQKAGTGQRKPLNGRRLSRSKSADRDTRYHLKASGMIGADDEVDEIEDHPFLDLLDRPFVQDGIGMMGRFTLFEITQLFLEDIGRSYWAMELGANGEPVQLFPLVANNVEEYRTTSSAKFVDFYKYQTDRGIVEIPFNEVVPFRCPSLTNPYTGGYSPMAAAADRVGVNLSFMAQTQALLNNRARPDFMLSPKSPDTGIGRGQIKRMIAEFTQLFQGRNRGKPFIPMEAVEYTALTFPPKDLGELKEDEEAVKQICRIFDVPLSMVNKDANRASAEEGRKQHANDALCPRLCRLEQSINANVMPRYDASGRTFVKFDEPYKAPMVFEAKDVAGLVNVVFTPDEVRERFGYGPMPEDHKAEMERIRQEELNAKKPPMKPPTKMTPKELSDYTFNRVRNISVNGKGSVNGCRH